MMKMLVKLNNSKILNDGIYSVETLENAVEEAYNDVGLYKDKNGFYVGGGFIEFGAIIMGLSRKKWFLENVEKWLWYNSDGQKSEDDFVIDDMAEYYKKEFGFLG